MLTLPLALAALSAGVIGGVHCAGMCGGISTLLTRARFSEGRAKASAVIPIVDLAVSKGASVSASTSLAAGFRYQLQLQGGRIFTYMLVGAIFGALGSAGMMIRPYLPIQKILFVIGNLSLIVLGLRLFGVSLAIEKIKSFTDRLLQFAFTAMPAIRQGSRYPFLIGMGWGCLPCGLLYGIAPFALLSGDAFSGALLMLMFGISALPHVLLTQGLFRDSSSGKFAYLTSAGSACILIAIGLFGLWHFDMKDMPNFLCVIPNS
ncbi:MAG: sulfite exporter TauE/SafE family protein [Burkholderiales bacterium]|nr:sulfite exporter TauE/SafE family protein [Burkholderiales bacterium]